MRGTIQSWTGTTTHTNSTTPKTPSQKTEVSAEASALETVTLKITVRDNYGHTNWQKGRKVRVDAGMFTLNMKRRVPSC